MGSRNVLIDFKTTENEEKSLQDGWEGSARIATIHHQGELLAIECSKTREVQGTLSTKL